MRAVERRTQYAVGGWLSRDSAALWLGCDIVVATMNATTQEYVTDVTYVRGFQKDLSPVRVRLCAAVNGFEPPPRDTFDYCELGCAYGDTTVALAASFPRARFVGIDLNAEHARAATTTARDGNVGNVRFLERDFETIDRGELPAFDYITAHGVLSWIGPSKRKALIELVSSKLKPGGLAYLSYNALPGWAGVEPLRQLILARAALLPGKTLEGAKLGLDFAKALSDVGAYYFASNPAAKALLDTLEKAGLKYVVHEYLHAHWVPMYFAQLAAEMAASDLYFVGQMPLYLNFRDVSIPTKMTSIFEGVTERLAFEGLKDFALNTYFRSDVFVKGRAGRSEETTRAYFEATPFGMTGEEPPFNGEGVLPNHTLKYRGPVYDALVPALREGAATIPELAKRADLAALGEARIREAITHLLLGGCVSPMVLSTQATEVRGALAVTSPYNEHVLERGLSSDAPTVLASTVLGNGLHLSKLETVALASYTLVEPSKRNAWLEDICRNIPYVAVGDRVIVDLAERKSTIVAKVEAFRARLPKLVELGVVSERK